MIRQCANCHWYASYEGVCCNGDSPNRGDFVDADHSDCPYWEKGKDNDE